MMEAAIKENPTLQREESQCFSLIDFRKKTIALLIFLKNHLKCI